MSKQSSVYLLPSDVERLFADLQSKLSFRCLQKRTSGMVLVDLVSPLRHGADNGVVSVFCYLAHPTDADVKVKYYPTLSAWLIEVESEVIEFSGCDSDGETLRVGRFYFRTDFLAGQEILPRRPGFVAWADKLFRYAKRSLSRDAVLDAYLGVDAEQFRKNGGTFRQF